MGDVQVLGVISHDAEEPRLAYLDEPVAATPEILELAAPVAVSEVFRLSARCEEKKCTHFDGARCQLAVRIAKMLPPVVDTLPACNIRRECRWFRQEGRAACAVRKSSPAIPRSTSALKRSPACPKAPSCPVPFIAAAGRANFSSRAARSTTR
jgi:hypothetical protein